MVVYLDDVVIFSRSAEEHFHHLEEVFRWFRQHNLKLKPRKCELFRTKVKYLGHVVTPAGVATDPGLVEKISNWEPPTDQKGVRVFLGLRGYYWWYVPAYGDVTEPHGDVAEPLVHLTDNKTPFNWTSRCQQAFEQLKTYLTSAPLLALPQDHRHFHTGHRCQQCGHWGCPVPTAGGPGESDSIRQQGLVSRVAQLLRD